VNILKIRNRYVRISKIVIDNQIALIHSNSPRNNIISHLLGKKHKIPVIWHERNIPFDGEKDLSKKFMNKPDAIICNSKAVARRFENNGKLPSHIHPILNGVDLGKFNLGSNVADIRQKYNLKDEFIIGTVTNLNKRKRVEYFLNFAFNLSKRIQNIKFMVVGGEFASEDESQLESLQSIAKEYGIEKDIIFTGFVSDVNRYYALFDLFVHVARREACSRAIMEAMSCGKPVVSINEGGNPELVQGNITGRLVDPEDLGDLLIAVEELYHDKSKRFAMAKESRFYAETRFDVKRNARETQNLYNQLIGKYATRN